MPDDGGSLSSISAATHRISGIPHPLAPGTGIQFRSMQPGNFHGQQIMTGSDTGTAHVDHLLRLFGKGLKPVFQVLRA